jgi:hypothetical protein
MSMLCHCGHAHHDGVRPGVYPQCGAGWQHMLLRVRKLATTRSFTHVKDTGYAP